MGKEIGKWGKNIKCTLHFPHLLTLIRFTNLPEAMFLAVSLSMLKVPTPKLLSSSIDFCCTFVVGTISDFTATAIVVS